MSSAFATFERRARYLACLLMLVIGLAALAMRFGLVTAAPSYKSDAWYADDSYVAGVIVISEYADESECRAKVSASASCRSGKSLMDKAGANSSSGNG